MADHFYPIEHAINPEMSRSQLKAKPVAEMIMRPFSIELKQLAWQR